MSPAPPASPLPVPVRPIDGEVLSSWYVRLAHAHGEKLNSFGRRLLGRGRQVSNTDIDRAQWQELLYLLSVRTGVSLERLRKMTLLVFEGFLWGELPVRGPTRWILPIVCGKPLAGQGTLQFCGACLATDRIPYFRVAWRLAFFVWCPVHRVLMQDRCHRCSAPVRIHQSDVWQLFIDFDSGLARCAVCGADRRAFFGRDAVERDMAGIELQGVLLRALENGFASIGSDGVHSIPLFQGVAIVWSLLDDTRRSAGLWASLTEPAPDAAAPARSRYGGFERQDVSRRRQLLEASAKLMKEGTQSLTAHLRAAGLSSDDVWRFIRTQRVTAPYWLWRAVRDTVNRAMHTPTSEEIGQAIRHVAMHAAPNPPSMLGVCQLLGLKNRYNPRVASAMRTLGVLGSSGRKKCPG